MLKRVLVGGLAISVGFAILVSCNSSTTNTTKPGTGNLIALVGDTPVCNVGSMHFLISGLQLTQQGTTNNVAILNPSTNSFKINFGSLRDAETFLSIGTFAQGTYDTGFFQMSLGQLGVFDPTLVPPAPTLVTGSLSNTEPTFTVSPPLVVNPGQLSVVRFDMDMLRSIEVDSNGQITKIIKPVFTATPVTLQPDGTYGRLENLIGFVRSVVPYSPGTSFVGNFSMQLLTGSLPQGPVVNVNFASTTQMFGVTTTLSDLLTGTVVEVDGYLDRSGNLVADTVEAEGQEDPDLNQVALIGPIISIARDATGNVTQFTQWVQDQQPDDTFSIPFDSEAVVNISTSTTAPTTYQYSSRTVNFTSPPLAFDSTSLAVGQQVIVYGPFTPPPPVSGGETQGPVTVAATQIYLKMQTIQGSFTRLVQAAPDNRTGAFQMAPCCTLLQGAPIYVLTTGAVTSTTTKLTFQTKFQDVAGLNELTPQSTLLVKGMPFFEPNATSINGVPIPAGTLVILASQVHQL